MKCFPCPSDRELTDTEIERIAALGWREWKREIHKDDEDWKDDYEE